MAYFPEIRAVSAKIKAYLLNLFNCFPVRLVILSNSVVADFIAVHINGNDTTDNIFAHVGGKAARCRTGHENDFAVVLTENSLFICRSFRYIVFPKHQVPSDFASHSFLFKK